MEIEDIHWSLASLAGKSAVETAFLRIRECASGRKSDEDDALSANDDGQWWATVQCLERSCVFAPSQQQFGAWFGCDKRPSKCRKKRKQKTLVA